ELLYRFRLSAGLSRMELADRVLCSENYVYRLESRDPRHRRVPTPWLVRALSEALGLTADQNEALLRARDRLERDRANPGDRPGDKALGVAGVATSTSAEYIADAIGDGD